MKLQVDTNINFREQFGKLDSSVFVTPKEVAIVIAAPSLQAIYLAIARGDLPEPMIRQNRRIRWSVGQIRDHLRQMEQSFQERLAKSEAGLAKVDAKRRGRPRAGV